FYFLLLIKKKKKKKKKKGIQRVILVKVYGEHNNDNVLKKRMNKATHVKIKDQNAQIEAEDEWNVNPLFLNVNIFDDAAFEAMTLLRNSFSRFCYTKEYENLKKKLKQPQLKDRTEESLEHKKHEDSRTGNPLAKTLRVLAKATSDALSSEHHTHSTQDADHEEKREEDADNNDGNEPIHKMVSVFDEPVVEFVLEDRSPHA
ncbi:hypothetical protein RFI_16863, partial [Reticulomyxa filosa]